MATSTMTVTIPACSQHEGIFDITVKIDEHCSVCGERRGDVFKTYSYDGSRRLYVDGWHNPCGHIDKYSAVRCEAAQNGFNQQAPAPAGVVSDLEDGE